MRADAIFYLWNVTLRYFEVILENQLFTTMKTLFTLLLSLFCLSCTAQRINYSKIQDTVCPSFCRWPDFEFVTEYRPKLLALDTNELLPKSLANYYRDVAMMEYYYYAYTLDTSAIRNSARCHLLAVFHDPKRYNEYRSAAQAFSYLNECDQMKRCLELYKAKIPDRYYNNSAREQVEFLESKCDH